MRLGGSIVIFITFVTSPLFAQSVLPAKDHTSPTISNARIVQPVSVPERPQRVLPAAQVGAADRLAAIEKWNAEGGVPRRVGLRRELSSPIDLRIGNEEIAVATANSGYETLVARIEIEDAWALRVQFSECHFPEGSEVTVFGSDLVGMPVESAEGHHGELWAPTVRGPYVIVQIMVPREEVANLRGSIRHVGELLPLTARPDDQESPENDACLVDRACRSSSTYAAIEAHSGATALLLYPVSADLIGACSGALLNDSDDSGFIPYFLTANHCIGSQSAASASEFFWNFQASSCGGSDPDLMSLPRASGATLLTTSSAADFSLLRISNPPSGLWYLGWDARASSVPAGTILHRVAHSSAEAQSYSRTYVVTTSSACPEAPRPTFLYQRSVEGSITTGASGGLVALGNGQVVGTLSGGCGPADNCASTFETVDGTLTAAWPLIGPYLYPSTVPDDTCTPNQTTACLLGKRFRATLRYRNAFDDKAVNTAGYVKSVTGFSDPNYETAFFYFNSANNIEVMLKMLDQGNTNSSGQPTIAVLFGTATPLRAEITITDTKTGATRVYTSGFNQMKGTTDFTAFVK